MMELREAIERVDGAQLGGESLDDEPEYRAVETVTNAARRFLALTETGQEARLPCEHGRYEDHPKPDAEPTGIYGVAGMSFADEDWCRNWSAALADYLTEEET